MLRSEVHIIHGTTVSTQVGNTERFVADRLKSVSAVESLTTVNYLFTFFPVRFPGWNDQIVS